MGQSRSKQPKRMVYPCVSASAYSIVIQVAVHFCPNVCLIIVACLELCDPFLQIVRRRVHHYLRYLIDQILKTVSSNHVRLPPDRLVPLCWLCERQGRYRILAERCKANSRPLGQSMHCSWRKLLQTWTTCNRVEERKVLTQSQVIIRHAHAAPVPARKTGVEKSQLA